jgi:hypothetical protein
MPGLVDLDHAVAVWRAPGDATQQVSLGVSRRHSAASHSPVAVVPLVVVASEVEEFSAGVGSVISMLNDFHVAAAGGAVRAVDL